MMKGLFKVISDHSSDISTIVRVCPYLSIITAHRLRLQNTLHHSRVSVPLLLSLAVCQVPDLNVVRGK